MRSRFFVTAVLILPVALGCGRPPSLPGKVEDIVGIQGEYFPKSPDQRTSFKGGAAEGRAFARLLLQGTPHEPCKCQGRAAFDLVYADGKRQSVEVYTPEPTVGIGGNQYVVDMNALVALLEKLSSQK